MKPLESRKMGYRATIHISMAVFSAATKGFSETHGKKESFSSSKKRLAFGNHHSCLAFGNPVSLSQFLASRDVDFASDSA